MGMQVSGLDNFLTSEVSEASLLNGKGPRGRGLFSLTVKLGSMLIDASLVLAGWSLGFAERFLMQPESAHTHWLSRQNALLLLVYLTILVLSCHANGLYDKVRQRPAVDEVVSIVRAQILASCLLTIIVYLSSATIISPWIIAATAVTNIGTFIAWRILLRTFVTRRFERGYGVRNILIMGAGEVGRAMANYFAATNHHGYHFTGFLDARADWPNVLGHPRDFAKIARSHFIDVLFITSPSDRELVKTVIMEARRLNVSVKIVPDFFDGLAWNSPIEHLGEFPVQVVHRSPISLSALLAKRVVDVVASATALLILLPVFLVIAVVIHLDSDGPILYRAERVGKKARRFVCYKFRTMVANADALKDLLRHLNEREGVLFKIREDPRTTRTGRFLRKYSLDELPQLWNVLKGEMSLVGPRPPVDSEVEMYSLDHLRRLNVTPGITGLWQVTARQDPSFNTYFALDLEYIESWSPLLDLKLLFKTIPAVFRGTGQ